MAAALLAMDRIPNANASPDVPKRELRVSPAAGVSGAATAAIATETPSDATFEGAHFVDDLFLHKSTQRYGI